MCRVDSIIIGAGAAGLFCGRLLGQAGLKVKIFEKEERPGKKLAISGRGHANFTNLHMRSDCYVPSNREKFFENIFSVFPPAKSLSFIKKLGLNYVEKGGGKIFLLEKASSLVSRMVHECKKNDVEILCDKKVTHADLGNMAVRVENRLVKASSIIFAQGSGAGFGDNNQNDEMNESLNLVKMCGLKVRNFSPALVPLKYNKNNTFKTRFGLLSGISCTPLIRINNGIFCEKGDLLFTHHGLSGPVILNASLYWKNGDALEIDFLPDENFEEILDMFPKQTPLSSARRKLPTRLAEVLLPEELAKRKNGQLSRTERKELAEKMHKVRPGDLHKGSLGSAEVCKGGVELDSLDPASMRVKGDSDVYCLGEMVNMTGRLGGYNLHWAWGSAMLCANAILKNLRS